MTDSNTNSTARASDSASPSTETLVGGTKARNWSITINNPNESDYSQIEMLKSKSWCKEWKGQVERGESGTLHIQGCVKTDNIRFSMLKKVLPRAHIEVARNAVALRKYVEKVETRVAPLTQIRTAGLPEIQRELIRVAIENLQHKGNWCSFVPIYGRRSVIKPESFTKKVLEDQSLSIEQIVDHNEVYIEHNKQFWFDNAVNNLIREGYFAVEMFGANPLTRNSILKYFSSILIRTHNGTQAQAPPPISEETSPPQEEIDE